jgi:sulfite reductase (NADPH) flavoprotein alpha-component
MLPEAKLNSLNELINKHSKEELIWISGYISGLLAGAVGNNAAAGASAPPAAEPAVAIKAVTILYGTETGNAKRAATAAANIVKQKGIRVKLASAEQYKLTDLPKETNLLIIMSTQGDGEPPVAAQKFYDHIHQQKIDLSNTNFSVLALGSYSYPLFCQAGVDVDAQLEKLGAKRIIPVVKCTEDFEDDASIWLSSTLETLAGASKPAVAAPTPVAPKGHVKKDFTGTLAVNINLNDRGSSKETHHIEFTLDEEISYKAGDALGIVPENSDATVQKIIEAAGLEGDEVLDYKDEVYKPYNLLKHKVNVLHLPERIVKKYAALVDQEIPATKIDFYDLLRIYPVKNIDQFREAVQLLDPIAPRLYSLASSPEAHNGELHVTVARSSYSKNGEKAYGLCSDFLSQLPLNSKLSMYIHKSQHFHLPEEDKDLIMIGPGTGIAPFRAFIAERDAIGASGRNWLFFGDQHFITDFLYQTEIQGWKETGVLQRVSLAFSRDQQEKVYVQHRMAEEAEELWQWINKGAYIYVCGTKDPMSYDVEKTLLAIIANKLNSTEDAARNYLELMEAEGRYAKDVY